MKFFFVLTSSRVISGIMYRTAVITGKISPFRTDHLVRPVGHDCLLLFSSFYYCLEKKECCNTFFLMFIFWINRLTVCSIKSKKMSSSVSQSTRIMSSNVYNPKIFSLNTMRGVEKIAFLSEVHIKSMRNTTCTAVKV